MSLPGGWRIKSWCTLVGAALLTGHPCEASNPFDMRLDPHLRVMCEDAIPGTVFRRPAHKVGQDNEGRIGQVLESTFPCVQRLDDELLLSAYGLFNRYPPGSDAGSPGELSIETASGASASLLSLLPDGFPRFEVLEKGVLRAGSRDDANPIGIFRTPNGLFVAAYLHRNYEMRDGEGVSIEISGMIFDSEGDLLRLEQGLSSWYEYEGAIRIRNFVYSRGCLATTEQVFDAVERDQSGKALSYVAHDEPGIVKTYATCASER